MLQRIFNAAELAVAPKDENFESRMPADRMAWVYGYNLSPFCFEIQNETGRALVIAMPFAPFKHPLGARTEKLILHVSSGAMVPAMPLAPADLAFYIGITEFEPDLIPGPW